MTAPTRVNSRPGQAEKAANHPAHRKDLRWLMDGTALVTGFLISSGLSRRAFNLVLGEAERNYHVDDTAEHTLRRTFKKTNFYDVRGSGKDTANEIVAYVNKLGWPSATPDLSRPELPGLAKSSLVVEGKDELLLIPVLPEPHRTILHEAIFSMTRSVCESAGVIEPQAAETSPEPKKRKRKSPKFTMPQSAEEAYDMMSAIAREALKTMLISERAGATSVRWDLMTPRTQGYLKKHGLIYTHKRNDVKYLSLTDMGRETALLVETAEELA